MHEEVANGAGGALEQVYVAEDSGIAELILILHIRAIAPLEHENSQAVVALMRLLGDVKLGSGVRNLRISDESTVEPDIERAVNALKVEECARRLRVSRVREVANIHATRIILRHKRRVARVGVVDVGVHMRLAAQVLPHGRHSNRAVLRSRGEVGGSEEWRREGCIFAVWVWLGAGNLVLFFLQLPQAGIVTELPLVAGLLSPRDCHRGSLVAQQLETVRMKTVVNKSVSRRACRNVIRAVWLGSAV